VKTKSLEKTKKS